MPDQVIRIEGSAELRTRYVREVYEAGLRDGIGLASALIDERIAAALQRPDDHGGPDLDAETRERVKDLYMRYLGVGLEPEEVPF